MHLVQASTLLPLGNFTHWRFGYFLFLMVGLYFPRSFFNFQTIIDFFPQIEHCLAMMFNLTKFFYFFQVRDILKTLKDLITVVKLIMLIELLFINPLVFFMIAVSILLALSIHEYSHAQMAYFLGDPTAKYQGRLTVNPLKHLDPIGTLMIFIVGFGWGKPVPFNPHNLKNQKWGPALVGLAGPLSNLTMAIFVSLFLRFMGLSNPGLVLFFSIFVWLNILLGVFNLLPIPPLDGSHIFFTILPPSLEHIKISLLQSGFLLIIMAFLFMIFIGVPFICRPFFTLITGIPSIF